MKCLFCHEDRPQTREHILSEPIALLAGIDRRNDSLAELDAESMAMITPPISPNSFVVRGPCARCNAGWMARIDREAAGVLLAPSGKLGEASYNTVAAWLLKMYFVFGLRSAHFGNPFGPQSLREIIPDVRRAKTLGDGDWAGATADIAFGIGRVGEWKGLWAFGHPSVRPWNLAPLVGALAISLRPIDVQLWIAVPTITAGCSLSLPSGIEVFRPGLHWETRPGGSALNAAAVRATFGAAA